MNADTQFILSFSDIRAADLPLVGGKGANLGEMTHAGFPVPGGFCLTTAAFQQFMDASPEAENIYRLLDGIQPDDVESVRSVGERIRQALLEVPVSADIVEAVRQAWQAEGTDHAYAVRSSATAEDLPDASFAGQQDTYLNVIGKEDLLTAIRSCWVSLFTDRAILYRSRNGFNHRDVQLSVVVQRMVMSEKSGILFTADPLTGQRHTLTIDASYGLGEALVGGLVTPDAYRVDKRTRTILERQVADKQVGIFPQKDGGTRQIVLDEAQCKGTVLTDKQVLDLADLGINVEMHYGLPQDIEWAIADGKLYLLQARPITSLYPINGLASPDESLHVFLSLGHQQSMMNAMTPLSLSTIQVLMPIGHAENRFDNAYIRTSGGRMFADITKPLRHPVLHKVLLGLLSQIDALAPESVRQVILRPEFRHPHGLRFDLSKIGFFRKVAGRVFSALWRRDMTGFVDQTNTLMDEYIAEVTRSLEALPPGKEQLEAVLDAMPDFFPFFLNWIPETGAGIAATRILTRLAGRWLSPEELEALTLGIAGNVVNEMNQAICGLAGLAGQSPPLVESFKQLGDDGNQWIEQAALQESNSPFMAALKDFLSRYGTRGPSEIDISKPRWYEEPLPVLRVIAEYLSGDEGRFCVNYQLLTEEREVVLQKLCSRAGKGLFGKMHIRIIDRLYHVMTELGGMREHHKFMIVRLLAVIKEILKNNAAQLVAANKLKQMDDIWFLTWGELLTICDQKDADLQNLISQRRMDLEQFEKLAPPLIVTSDGEAPVVQYQIDDAPEGALLGNPVSPGMVEGVVRVIQDPQRETLLPGEILVAEFTDPGWTPLFINASGLILEVGGALTHGAVVAREYGMPAVVGVREAIKDLQSGQRVRVDGNRGIIEIL